MVIARSVRGMNDLFEADLLSFRHIEKRLENCFIPLATKKLELLFLKSSCSLKEVSERPLIS